VNKNTQERRGFIRSDKFFWTTFVVITSPIAVFLLWTQTHKVLALFDFTYYTDNAIRILNGQIPYRDFTLFANPGSFYELAGVFAVFGTSYEAVFGLMAAQTIFVCLLVGLICFELFRNSQQKYLILAGLTASSVAVANVYFLFNQPYYDASATVSILLSMFLIIKSSAVIPNGPRYQWFWAFLAGSSVLWPFLYKQTFGIAWCGLLVLGWLVALIGGKVKSNLTPNVLGFSLTAFLIFFYLIINDALENWFEQTISYPLTIRNSSFFQLFDQLKSLERPLLLLVGLVGVIVLSNRAISKPKKDVAFFVPILFPALFFIAAVIPSLDEESRAEIVSNIWISILPLTLSSLILFMILAVVGKKNFDLWDLLSLALIGSLMTGWLSQGFLLSSHATWPLVLIGVLIALRQNMKYLDNRYFSFLFLCSVAAVVVFVIGIFISAMSLARYSWLDPSGEAKPVYGLSWASTPGNSGVDTETAAELFIKYSKMGKTTVFPGEEPIAFVTGIIPATDVSASDRSTNPLFDDLQTWIQVNKIRYVIVRKDGQSPGVSNILAERIEELTEGLYLVEQKGRFTVYHTR